MSNRGPNWSQFKVDAGDLEELETCNFLLYQERKPYPRALLFEKDVFIDWLASELSLTPVGTDLGWFPTATNASLTSSSGSPTTITAVDSTNAGLMTPAMLAQLNAGGVTLDDTAYGPSWNGDTTNIATKNAIYDKIETIVGGGGGGLNNIVEDTTPQLGGDLDLNSNDITGTGNVDISGTITATTVVSKLDGSVIFQAKNVNAGTISKGQVVYISGLSGNKPEVDLARANSSSTMPAFGIAAEDIATTVVGNIVTFGSLQGLDVADFGETGITFSLGDTVYVSSSEAGKLTNVAPSGESNQIQNIGRIQRISPTTNATIKVGGAGRSAATPALNDGNIFIGNASNNSSTAHLQTLVESYSINNLVEDTTPQLGGTLDANGNSIDMGINVISDTKVGQWDTAYGWGDHSTQGYLTSFTETNDLSTAVTWADVPDANITQSSVTQHEGAIDHGSIAGLTDDDHTQYALLSGRSGGQTISGGTAASEDLTLQSTTDATKGLVLVPDGIRYAAHIYPRNIETVTDTANVEFLCENGNVGTLTLGGNRTFAFNGDQAGGTYILILKQDATGSRTVTWNASILWPDGTAPTLSTAANAVDIITFISDGTNQYAVAVQNFS